MKASQTPTHSAAGGLGPARLGRFVVLEHLGCGRHGEVWAVEDPLRDRARFALKLLRPKGSTRDLAEAARGLARELRVGGAVRHPALARLFEAGTVRSGGEEVPYLLGELVRGKPLSGTWSAEDLEAVFEDIGDALLAIHDAGWRHGDLHPDNVLVEARGTRSQRARLLDFGLASRLGAAGGGGGTPRYLAPEVLAGGAAGGAADFYALGLMLYECLGGREASPLAEHLARTRTGDFYREVQARLQGRSEPACRAVLALLDPDPEARLRRVRARLEALARASGRSRAPPAFVPPHWVGDPAAPAAIEAAITAAARGGGPRLVYVEGAAGMGKTRLLEEARIRAFEAGLRVLDWKEALRRVEELASAETLELSSVEFARRADDLQGERAALAAGVLRDILEEAPTLLAVDGAGGLPRDEQRVLSALIEALRAGALAGRRKSGVAAVVAVRPQEGGARAVAPPPGRWVAAVSLEPWNEAGAKAYLDAVLGRDRRLGPLEEEIIAHGGGVPERMRSALTALFQAGALVREDGVWTARGGAPPALPPGREAFEERWDALSDAERGFLLARALSARAEAEGRLPRNVACAVTGLDDPGLEDLLRRLEVSGFGVEGLPGADVPAAGALERVEVLRRAGHRERRRWRRRLAEAAEHAGDGFEAAAQRSQLEPVSPERILETAAGLSRRARRVLFERYVRSPRTPPRWRSPVTLALAEELLQAGEAHRARILLETRFENTGPEGESRAALLRAQAALASGDPQAARSALAPLVEAARLTPGAEAPARALLLEATALHMEGKPAEALEVAQRALAAGAGGPSFENAAANAEAALGRLDAAERRLRRALRRASGRRERGALRANLARILARLGKLPGAVAEGRRALGDLEATGARSLEAQTLANLGVALRRLGDYEEALACARRSLELWRLLENRTAAALVEANLGILCLELGLIGSAKRRFERALRPRREGGAAEILERSEVFWTHRGLLAAALGDAAEALRCRERAWRIARRDPEALGADGFLLEVETALLLEEKGERAEGDTVELDAFLDRSPPREGGARALARLVLGALRLEKAGRPPAGTRLAAARARARRALRALRANADTPRARFAHALVEFACGEEEDPGRARAVLESEAQRFPLRDLKREAFILLASRSKELGERENWSRLLRRLLDEVLADMDPEERVRFEARLEIREALKVVRSDETERGPLAAAREKEVLETVFRINREILSERRIETLLRRIVDAAIMLSGAERGVLAVRRRGRIEFAAAREGGRDLGDPEATISRTVIERTLAEGAARLATDAREDLDLRSIRSVEELGLRSVLCVPLKVRNRLIGVLYLDNRFERGVFTGRDLQLAESFCGQAGLAWVLARSRTRRAELLRRLREANRLLGRELEIARREAQRADEADPGGRFGLVGRSAALREAVRRLEILAPTDIPVLITGESGTGKELAARALWRMSRRADRPFIAENCAALPPALAESVLFGHVKGAFTGAEADRPGLFVLADGGTLFLDEIGELAPDLQSKLLRALQEGEVRPLGSDSVRRVDVRVIAATNRDVGPALREGVLREDLYYRLQGAEVHMPALRERPEDIPLLAAHFFAKYAGGGEPKRLGPDALELFVAYGWPGNVRELENEVRRLALFARGPAVRPEDLAPAIRERRLIAHSRGSGGERPLRTLKEVEREAILDAMERLGGRRGEVAKALGISRSTLYLKLKEYGVK